MSSAADTDLGAVDQRRRIRIQRASSFSIDFRELWAYHELLYFMVWRDVKVRYKQTLLGIIWAVIQPFMTMVLFSAIFGGLAGIKPGTDIPYPLFVYAGILPWTYFSTCVSSGGGSVVAGSSLVTKVYFPRILLPLETSAVPIVDLSFSALIFAGLFAWYGRAPSWHVIAVPALLLLALLSAFGIGLWLSALNVRYRDVRYMVGYVVQIWMYVTPVIYPPTLVPARFRWLLSLNPMTGVVNGFRWAILGVGSPDVPAIGFSLLIGVVLMLSGVWYFRRVERRFADVI